MWCVGQFLLLVLLASVFPHTHGNVGTMRRSSVANVNVNDVALTWREGYAHNLCQAGTSGAEKAATCAPPQSATNAGTHQFPYLATILIIILGIGTIVYIVQYGDGVMGTTRATYRDLDD